jgi:cobalt-zinc-cadmium efflux system protein
MNANHAKSHGASGNIGVAFFLNLAFTLIELAGGLWTNSIAILSDALHDFGDCITLGFAWYLQRVSRRPGDHTFTYGYRRFSVLGALITGLVLLVGLLFIVWNSAARLLSPEPVYAPGMIAIAIVGIVFNGAAVLRVRGGSSLNEKVMSWHLLEDVLGWAAVLLGSIAMLIWDLPIIDPLLSIGISLFVLWNVIKNVRKVFMVFMQSAPKSFDPARFRQAVTALDKAVSSHHTHVWSIDGEHHVLSTHLVMQSKVKREEILAAKRRIHELLKKHKFEHVTIDVELEGEDCTSDEDDAHADSAKK